MSDKYRNSLKVNVEEVTSERQQQHITETYKPISEDQLTAALPALKNGKAAVQDTQKNGNSAPNTGSNGTTATAKLENGKETAEKMVQEGINANDGADEQMLGTEDQEKLAEKREEVKFIKGDHQNGDAKIDISGVGNGKQAFTGMTKEELMKYANDPFWVRLRWIFFVAFWAIWVGMLVGAILIIVDAPKCAAPEPLPWYKRGIIAKFAQSLDVNTDDRALAKKLHTTGVIYELPAEQTYSVQDAAIEQKIKNIIDTYKDSDINVILDITPNYVNKDAKLFREALADKTKRSAFMWYEQEQKPNNWVGLHNKPAWTKVEPSYYVLSQFGEGLYDLRMNDTLVKNELTNVLKHLVQLGVKGFRLKNSKFFLLSNDIGDEEPAQRLDGIHDEYRFWTHTKTTFNEGLGNLLYEYLTVVKETAPDGFLTVADDVVRPESYKMSTGGYGIDMPIYGRFAQQVISSHDSTTLQHELHNTMQDLGNETWVQWDFTAVANTTEVKDASAIVLFVSLLPGVPVVPLTQTFRNISDATYKHIEQLRLSHSYMHGDFDMYNSNELLGYSRIKSGNPGYFVAFNPTDITLTGDFSQMGKLPEKMTVDAISDNYNITDISVKSKMLSTSVEVSPHSTIIFTYVPKSG